MVVMASHSAARCVMEVEEEHPRLWSVEQGKHPEGILPRDGSVLQAEGRSDADRGLQQALRASPHPPGGTALEASAGRRAPLYSRLRPRSAPTRVSPSKAAPQGRGRTPVAPPVTAASPLLPRSGSSLAQCVNTSPAGRPGRGLLAVPISPGHSGTRSGGVRPHLRDLPFHGTRRLPLRTPEHPPQRLQAPMQSRPLRSRSFKRAPCSAPWPRPHCLSILIS
ncbi:hypothetical protein NDU88_002790 [Pleurodeles waltl]|uniref:Uncharacterized protein n=1 Tax=Pleurodeles waltl TaxID=8319 RepID=A0AAV7W5K7_PLEWA|nr:hypothetical protein NDU88_002790 [Pleurodeles waltl]